MNISPFRTRCLSSMKKWTTLQALSGIYYYQVDKVLQANVQRSEWLSNLMDTGPISLGREGKECRNRDVTGIGQFLTMIVSCWYLLGQFCCLLHGYSRSFVYWKYILYTAHSMTLVICWVVLFEAHSVRVTVWIFISVFTLWSSRRGSDMNSTCLK